MTARHLTDGLMQVTRAHSYAECERMLGLPQALLCRMSKADNLDLNMSTLLRMRSAGVSVETLVRWYEMPEGQQLGRVSAEPMTINGQRRMIVHQAGFIRLSQLALLALACFCAYGVIDQDGAAEVLERIGHTIVACVRG